MAQAHAVLKSASPTDGSLLQTAPEAVRLTFNEAVRPLVIRLIGPDGAAVELTDQVQGAAELVVPLPELARGSWMLSWRVVSEDGHPIPGTLLFSIGTVTGALAEEAPALGAALWLMRFVMAVGLVLGAGGAVFAALTGVRVGAVRLATGGGMIAAPAYLGLHGLDALGLPLPAILTAAPWAAAWSTSFGPSIALAVLAGGLALLASRWSALAWAALVALALSYATSGHAGAAAPQALTRPMVALHLVALTFWIGALIPLTVTLRRGTQGLTRFSRLIPFAVAALFASGLVLAVIQLGRDPAQWRSAYGLILAAKLALLAGMLVLAAWNRWRLTGPVLAGNPGAARRMRRVIWAELVLAVVILGLTAGWRFTPPPRALATVSAPATPAFAHLHSDAVMAILTVTPGKAGPVAAEISVTDADLTPIPAQGVTLHLSLPEQGIERLTRPAEPVPGAEGAWAIPDLVLPLSGTWQLDLDIRLTRFKQVTLEGTFDLE